MTDETADVASKRVMGALALWIVGGLVVLLSSIVGMWARDLTASVKKQSEDVSAIKSDIRVLTTRLDGEVIAQVHANTVRIDKQADDSDRLRARVEVLENLRRLP